MSLGESAASSRMSWSCAPSIDIGRQKLAHYWRLCAFVCAFPFVVIAVLSLWERADSPVRESAVISARRQRRGLTLMMALGSQSRHCDRDRNGKPFRRCSNLSAPPNDANSSSRRRKRRTTKQQNKQTSQLHLSMMPDWKSTPTLRPTSWLATTGDVGSLPSAFGRASVVETPDGRVSSFARPTGGSLAGAELDPSSSAPASG